MEFFVPPDEADEWYRYWVEARFDWYVRYGIRPSRLRVRPHEPDELSHYSKATSDIEYDFPIGWLELEGIANRGDYDLTQHSKFSGTTLEYVGPDGERYVPHVVEPAVPTARYSRCSSTPTTRRSLRTDSGRCCACIRGSRP
jgi:glycyl-tRNA synthetase